MPETASTTVQIDVWFDLICPWCWIGKTHLDTARASWRSSIPMPRCSCTGIRCS